MRLLFFALVLTFLSCEEPKLEIKDGSYVRAIERNVVTFEDGSIGEFPDGKLFYLIRHAEKDTFPEKNPILTAEGYDRAARLAQIFKGTRLDEVHSTMYNRTLHTVDSLTKIKGLSTNVYLPKDLKSLSEELIQNENVKAALVVGHSNTTPALSGVFMGKKMFERGFDESDYDNLLVVSIPDEGEKKLYQLKFRSKEK